MPLEFMHNELLKQLKNNSASLETVDKFEIAWAAAMRNSGLPIPCPACFMKGSICRLSPLKDENKTSSARCVQCKTKYEWPSPD